MCICAHSAAHILIHIKHVHLRTHARSTILYDVMHYADIPTGGWMLQ
jgi:hypothetical protein